MTHKNITGIINKILTALLSEGTSSVVALLAAIAIYYIMNNQQQVMQETFKDAIYELRLDNKNINEKLYRCLEKHKKM